MLSLAGDSPVSVVLGRLSVHQDLLWFGVLVVWSLVFALWWRHPQRDALWGFLPWLAGIRVLGALVQFLVYDPPFDLFIERLVPGSNSLYYPAMFDPFLWADMGLAVLSYALMLFWWWRESAHRAGRVGWRILGLAALTGAVTAHLIWPGFSAWLLGLLPLASVYQARRQPANQTTAAWVFLLPALIPALSTIGPLAWHTGMMQRSSAATPMGVLAATYQLATAGLLLVYFWRRQAHAASADPEARRMGRPFIITVVGLLLVGVGYSLVTGEERRREVINNRLRATVHNAELLDPELFAVFTSAQLQLTDLQVAADGTGTARAPGLAPAIARAGRALAERVRATQFQKSAGFLVLHDDWLVEVAGTTPRPQPDSVLVRGRITADDRAAWAEQRLFVRYSPVPEQGAPYYCRAPLVDHTGRLLGWLESPREEFYGSMARKWRTGPLLVTALGIVLTAGLYFQKRANQERERSLRTAAVEAEANRLKTAFLAKVSHELRTPIQSLLGYGELLRGRVAGDAQAQAWLGALQQHGEIMTRLINDLIDLSAAESGAFRLAPRPIAPGTVVSQIVDSLAPRAAAKGLRLDCTIAPAVPAWVEADGGRLAQVVLNLVGNAIKFTDTGRVAVALDAAPAGAGRVRLTLTVRDTGPGIAPAEQAGLFQAFSRLERTAAKEGLGLGLALSAVLCEAMGGGLAVESDGVHGSCFRAAFVAPLAAAPAAAPVAATDPAPPRVLVVDDNTLVRELFVDFLRSRGSTCRAAATGAEAVNRARDLRPAVIVLDISLPDADGVGLVPLLQSVAPGVRIIGVSAHAGDGERERALAAGMAAFLVKPVPLAALWQGVTGGSVPATVPGYEIPPQLRATFHEELPRLRTELAAALAAGDLPRVRRRAHYLRNSALVVQAQDLLAACATLETAADRQAAGEAVLAWRQCETAIEKIMHPAA